MLLLDETGLFPSFKERNGREQVACLLKLTALGRISGRFPLGEVANSLLDLVAGVCDV